MRGKNPRQRSLQVDRRGQPHLLEQPLLGLPLRNQHHRRGQPHHQRQTRLRNQATRLEQSKKGEEVVTMLVSRK